jgi:hypothetical protein
MYNGFFFSTRHERKYYLITRCFRSTLTMGVKPRFLYINKVRNAIKEQARKFPSQEKKIKNYLEKLLNYILARNFLIISLSPERRSLIT